MSGNNGGTSILLGTPPAQKSPGVFSYKDARTQEQWTECKDELQFRLKENMQAEIAPLAKAYGMKKAGPKTFIKEKTDWYGFLDLSAISGAAGMKQCSIISARFMPFIQGF